MDSLIYAAKIGLITVGEQHGSDLQQDTPGLLIQEFR